MNFAFGFLKELDFLFIIISDTLHFLFLHLVTPCVMFSLNVEEVNIPLRFLGCLLLLMTFVVSSISLILSLFLSSRFFIISKKSSQLFLL